MLCPLIPWMTSPVTGQGSGADVNVAGSAGLLVGSIMALVGSSMALLAPTSRVTLVKFRRSGGIAGVEDELTVYEDGSAEVPARRGGGRPVVARFRISRQDRDLLEREAGRLEAEGYQESGRPIPDAYSFSVTYRGRHLGT
jgi:hypothetical protein